MTDELKTLKDLPVMESPFFKRTYIKNRRLPNTMDEYLQDLDTPEYITKPIKAIDIEDIKAEAIKWVKEEIKISLKDCNEDYTEKNISWCMKDADIQRWMERFNLTEEDLK